MAELADAPDLGSGGRPWGFESLHPHESFDKVLKDNLWRNPEVFSFILYGEMVKKDRKEKRPVQRTGQFLKYEIVT